MFGIATSFMLVTATESLTQPSSFTPDLELAMKPSTVSYMK